MHGRPHKKPKLIMDKKDLDDFFYRKSKARNYEDIIDEEMDYYDKTDKRDNPD